MKKSVTELLDPALVAEVDNDFEHIATIGMRLTETGNAERLVARFRNLIRYCPPRKKWLTWNGCKWEWDERGVVKQMAKRTVRAIYAEAEHAAEKKVRDAIVSHAKASEKGAARKQMIDLAQSEEGMPVLPDELDANPWLFNVLNGTIDLKTGELRPHSRRDLITKLAPVKYEPGARHPLWDKYVTDATGGDTELAAYLQRSVGYALQGNVTEKAFWFLYGPPDGMKSTFIDAVSSTMGEYAEAADFTTWIVQTNTGGNRGDLVSLLGARLVCSVEVRKGVKFDEAVLKKVTGGDELKAAAKFEKEIRFRPSFALWLAANDAPVIRDDDDGAWSRVRRVPFDHPLPKDQQDPTMRERLRAPDVQTAILAWAVNGCLQWQRSGIGTCAAVERSSAAYRGEMDRIVGFFDESCRFEDDARVERKLFREAYEAWCKENGIKAPLSPRDIALRLRERGVSDGKSDGRRVWKGVRLLADWEVPAGEPETGTQGQNSDTNSRNPHEEKRSKILSVDDDPSCPCGPDPEWSWAG
jgi:putative DNA primase/helicase